MVVLYHSYDIVKKETHKYCPSAKDSWCQLKRTGSFENKDYHLDPVFMELLKPVFERLSNESLLSHCLPGFSQNNNESINSLVWARAPKHKYYGPIKVEMAVIGAVLQFNEGASGKHLVMEKAGISWGEHSESGSAQKDKQRVNKCQEEVISAAKKSQKEVERNKTEGRGGEKVNRREHHMVQESSMMLIHFSSIVAQRMTSHWPKCSGSRLF